jgi:hypothetical protein
MFCIAVTKVKTKTLGANVTRLINFATVLVFSCDWPST